MTAYIDWCKKMPMKCTKIIYFSFAITGNLPFGQELVSCKRFKHFCKWIKELPIKNSGTEFWGDVTIDYPEW